VAGNRFNDGKPDPRGRLFAGTIAYDGSDKKAALWRIEPDLTWAKLIDRVGNSNGLGWSPDEKTFYWTDTKTSCVFAFDYEAMSGDICNRRVVVEVDKAMGRPDGMTVDAEGFLWTALWAGHGVARWNPATGEMVECETCAGKVRLKVMACAVHGSCTTGKRVDGIACCGGCVDYRMG
jgi:sugar lactone lactonase YvrE